MILLREDALVVCTHRLGKVSLSAGQDLAYVEGVPLLVRADPEGRPIAGCPNVSPVTKPCTRTLSVTTGYSDLVTIDGRAACLDTLVGRTDGQGGIYEYVVQATRHDLVEER